MWWSCNFSCRSQRSFNSFAVSKSSGVSRLSQTFEQFSRGVAEQSCRLLNCDLADCSGCARCINTFKISLQFSIDRPTTVLAKRAFVVFSSQFQRSLLPTFALCYLRKWGIQEFDKFPSSHVTSAIALRHSRHFGQMDLASNVVTQTRDKRELFRLMIMRLQSRRWRHDDNETLRGFLLESRRGD